MFYGHFPDMLLVRSQPSPLGRLYRYPFDKLEAMTTGKNQHFICIAFVSLLSTSVIGQVSLQFVINQRRTSVSGAWQTFLNEYEKAENSQRFAASSGALKCYLMSTQR